MDAYSCVAVFGFTTEVDWNESVFDVSGGEEEAGDAEGIGSFDDLIEISGMALIFGFLPVFTEESIVGEVSGDVEDALGLPKLLSQLQLL